MSCAVGHRCGSDVVLLWLWCRLSIAALIRPLAKEPPYAMGAALKSKEKNKNKEILVSLNLPEVKKNLEKILPMCYTN